MAITVRSVNGLSAAADVSSPFNNLAWGIPAGIGAQDFIILFYGGKPYTTVPNTPSGYTAQSGGADGAVAMGDGTGSVYAIAYTKVADGSETSNPSVTMPAQYSPAIVGAIALDSSNDGIGWTVASCKGSDSTDTGTSVSITGDATLTYTTGDWIVVSVVTADNNSDSALSITVPGCVVGTVTQRLTTVSTTTGNDGSMRVFTAEITSGTASGAPTVSFTVSATPSNAQAVFLQVTEPASIGTTSRTATNFLDVLVKPEPGSATASSFLEVAALPDPPRNIAATGVAVLVQNDNTTRALAATGVSVLVPTATADLISGSESNALTITESSSLDITVEASESNSLSISESSSVDTGGSETPISASDTHELSFTESASVTITTDVSATDTTALSFTESASISVEVAISASDSSSLTVTETSDVTVPPASSGYIGWGVRI